MIFTYSRCNLDRRQRTLQRFFEILPGATSWGILLGFILLSLWEPLVAAALIIAFDLYWILRLFYMNIFLALSYARLSWERKTDWLKRIDDTRDIDRSLRRPQAASSGNKLPEIISEVINRRELAELKNSGQTVPSYDDIYQLVIMPVVRESRDIVEPGIKSLSEGAFPSRRILVVLAVEERSSPEIRDAAQRLAAEYRGRFLEFLVTLHPDGIAGEARVKGANATFAAKVAVGFFTEKNIPFENVIVSCFDADTIVNPDYFNCLTYSYIVTPNRTQASYQPIPVYHNNIWEAPAFARVLDIGSSFFQLIEATNPEQLVTFSSHSMSFQALVDVGYWPVDMISDDSAIFWKSYIHYDGRYRVIPLATTLSMDITQAKTWRKTLVNVYKQKRRWAWGVENFPILMRAFLGSPTIPLRQKLRHSFKLFEGHISWATWPFLLTFIGWLPTLFAGREFSHTVLYYTGPRITTTIFSLASIGLLNCIILSLLLLPKNPAKNTFWTKMGQALEWLSVPFIMIFLSGMPALDAQTRLALAKRLEFWVTEKERKKAADK
ncbi:hypothetical protein BU251_01885 [Candidatus Velamenicoccus archaeovorus]|uniref:Glycosyltransferase 2-like domain-containing protein n=1 Tax=Velamenicoccus archaeovorus TaxID=1930593 RepID=A0A410P2Z2_VELA1|nr:glycosyltransferase family 2 protein [Candidatus Velamenicoccus archaeovorus]QAT16565.1 hypothetical protein BU251_01885 [Candidatus Velamenicoccus archaeovorus]